MIDLHCHLLPAVDDGAVDWEDAMEMAAIAVADGIRQCAATPHWTGTAGEAERVRDRLVELRHRLAASGVPLEVHSGNEVVLVPQLIDALDSGGALPLAGSTYVLLETAQLELGAYVDRALFQLQSHGYRILLAHPERVRVWQKKLDGLQQLVARGCRLQVNAGSLLGEFGPDARRQAERLLRIGWVSLLASDAHSPTVRPPRLSEALLRCERIIGEPAAKALVLEHPARVICNEELPHIDADREAPRRLFGIFG